jgi:RNA polymerase sigma-70 factor (ECF subfamily)
VRQYDDDVLRDRALVRRWQQGDTRAFNELYARYHDRILRLCRRRLGGADEAYDVTQEAFVRVWRALPSVADDLRFYPWLTVIAKNLCTDRLRRRSRQLVAYDIDRLEAIDRRGDPYVPAAQSAEETVLSSIDGQLAVRALHRLSDRHQRILCLREERGLSYEEIAAEEGIAMTTVVTLIWRARQALKREFAALEGRKTVVGGILSALGTLRGLAGGLGRRVTTLGWSGRSSPLRELAIASAIGLGLSAGAIGSSNSVRPAGSPSVLAAAVAAANAPAATGQLATPTPSTTSGPDPVGSPAAGTASVPLSAPLVSSPTPPPSSSTVTPPPAPPPSPPGLVPSVTSVLPQPVTQTLDTVGSAVNTVA